MIILLSEFNLAKEDIGPQSVLPKKMIVLEAFLTFETQI